MRREAASRDHSRRCVGRESEVLAGAVLTHSPRQDVATTFGRVAEWQGSRLITGSRGRPSNQSLAWVQPPPLPLIIDFCGPPARLLGG